MGKNKSFSPQASYCLTIACSPKQFGGLFRKHTAQTFSTVSREGADPPVFLFLHLLAEVHCGSLDERALLVRCEFVVVAGEHDNGSVDVALREYRRGGYRVAVDTLDGVEPLILAGAVNVALALLDEVLQGA